MTNLNKDSILKNLNEDSIKIKAGIDVRQDAAVQKASDQVPRNYEQVIYAEIKKGVHELEAEFETNRLVVENEISRISQRMTDWKLESEAICSRPGLQAEVQLAWAQMRDKVVQKRVEAKRAHLTLLKFKAAFEPPIHEYENAELPLNEIGPRNNIWWIVAFLAIDMVLAFSQWRVSQGVTAAFFVTVGFGLVSLLGNIFLASKYKQHIAHASNAHKWIWVVIAFLANYAVLDLIHWARNVQSDLDAPIFFAWLTTYVPPTLNETTKALMEKLGMDVRKTSLESINAVFFWLTYFVNIILFIKLSGMYEKYVGYSLKKHNYESKEKDSKDAYQGFRTTLDASFNAKTTEIDTHILEVQQQLKNLASLNESFQNNMTKFRGYFEKLDAEAQKYIQCYRAEWASVAQSSLARPQFWSEKFTIHSIGYDANLNVIFTPDDPRNKTIIGQIQSLKSELETQANEVHNIYQKLNNRKTQYIGECTELIRLVPTLQAIDGEAHAIIQQDQDQANRAPMEQL